jgi:cytochrome c-type biogenesis protein CcsB
MILYEGYLFWLALSVYCGVIALYSYAMVFQRERAWLWGYRLLIAGFLIHAASIAIRWLATGHVPTVGNYENANLCALFLAAFTVGYSWKYPSSRATGLFILPVAVLTMGFGAMTGRQTSPMVAALRSWWLYIHIFFAWLVTGAMSFAFGASILFLVKEKKLRRGIVPAFFQHLPSLERLDELIYRNVIYGFIAYAAMIASGALWAKDLWGAYWSWDPVETWSLSSWLIYGLILHLRFTFGWGGRRMAWMVIFALISVFIVMFGVNFAVESSMHIFNVQ